MTWMRGTKMIEKDSGWGKITLRYWHSFPTWGYSVPPMKQHVLTPGSFFFLTPSAVWRSSCFKLPLCKSYHCVKRIIKTVSMHIVAWWFRLFHFASLCTESLSICIRSLCGGCALCLNYWTMTEILSYKHFGNHVKTLWKSLRYY